MTKTLIRKVERIKNYRIFQNWQPDGGVEFARVNLVYGQNGSGKSTFASLLAGCAANATAESESRGDGNDEASAGLQLLATHDAGNSFFQIGLDDREFWSRVRVFNKDFVHRSLRFEEPNGPSPEALLTIGKKLADAAEKLEELRPQLDEARQKLATANTTWTTTNNTINNRSSDIARQVTTDLSGAPGFNPRSYDRRNVKRLLDSFDSDPAVLAADTTNLLVDREIATGHAMRPVPLQPRGTLLEQEVLEDARALLSANILSNTLIGELVGHSDRSKWVQEGIILHNHLEKCLFCGQELTSDRLKALNAHFDESFKKLQNGIDNLIFRLQNSEATSKDYLDAFPARSEIYEDLHEKLLSSRETYEAEHKVYADTIHCIVSALKEKRENPFSIPSLSSNLVLTAPSVSALNSIVGMHQARIDHHDAEAIEAAERVKHYHARSFLDEYKQLKENLELQRAEINHQKDTVEDLERQITTLENVDGDPVPGAEELTKGLTGLLGRNELTFSAHGAKHYAIKRAGAPATHLSEGEQTAIALLYFLSSVRKDKIAGDPPIVVIDDPVSSLDQGILFGASAHIWSELVVNTYASQVFVLTHNFEFFRQWLIQMEAVPKKRREGGYTAYRVCAHVDDHGRRRPVFEVWELDDDRRKKLRSQYHFLFDQVATTLKESDRDLDSIAQMEAAALVPNTARKLLEGFLSFRTPANMGKLHESVRAALDARPGLDDSVRTMVVRYAHANSHLEEADLTKPLEPSESVPFLHALFTFMDHVDSEHFASMCQALGHDPEVLRSTSSSTAEEAQA